MALWCRDLPTIAVPRGAAKSVTLIVPYYENANFLQRQLAHWRTARDRFSDHFSVIVVDDGSPQPAVIDQPDVRLFRIDQDVRWNWLAARNIGAHHAPDGWLLLTDMDHVVPLETLDAVIHGQHRPGTIYAFSRREHTGAAVSPHSASFLMTRALFWQIGGYDETLSGYYGTDGDYRRRAARHAPLQLLPDVLIRHEYVEDASTTRYRRKQPEDAAVKRLVALRRPGWTPKVLSFPYHEVTPCLA